jgi:hypothetical protein
MGKSASIQSTLRKTVKSHKGMLCSDEKISCGVMFVIKTLILQTIIIKDNLKSRYK